MMVGADLADTNYFRGIAGCRFSVRIVGTYTEFMNVLNPAPHGQFGVPQVRPYLTRNRVRPANLDRETSK